MKSFDKKEKEIIKTSDIILFLQKKNPPQRGERK